MIMNNTTKNFTVEQHPITEPLDDAHYDALFYFRSYGALIGILYVRKEGLAQLHLMSNYMDYSKTTKEHIKWALGWSVYYFGDPFVKLPCEWRTIKTHTPRYKEIKTGLVYCDIKVTII